MNIVRISCHDIPIPLDKFFNSLKYFQNLNELVFKSFETNFKIPKGAIPSKITTLTLNSYFGDFKNILVHGSIPDSVTNLSIVHECFLHDIELIPSSVTNLTIHELKKSKNHLPIVPSTVSILNLYGEKSYDLQNGNIPDSVTELTFLEFPKYLSFSDKRLEESIIFPDSIKTLRMGNYNNRIPNSIIPLFVENLDLGKSKNSVPISSTTLLSLTFNNIFECPFDYFPCLQHLDCLFYEIKSGSLPKNLKSLVIRLYSYPSPNLNLPIDEDAFPQSLESISIPIHLALTFKWDYLPSSVKTLGITELSDEKVQVLPFNSISIPTSIENLTIVSPTNDFIIVKHRFLGLIKNLLIERSIRIKIDNNIRLMSLDRTDPYFYYIDNSGSFE
eukprot:gene11706-14331_t